MEFKRGDIVICKPGFTREEGSGGAGYEAGKVFKVLFITKLDTDVILWFSEHDSGIYARACEYYKPSSYSGSKLKFNFIHV